MQKSDLTGEVTATPTEPTYIDRARTILAEHAGELEPELLELYTLLVLVKGERVTMEDVHDAWAVWRSRTRSDHKSLIPFGDLVEEVQELDRPYANAIAVSARELSVEQR